MAIRLAEKNDLPDIQRIYEAARTYMAKHGNPHQWGTEYPYQEMIVQDIERQQLYVCTQEQKIYGVFALIFGVDETYARIEQGTWKSDTPYATIHRLAGDGTRKGVFAECMAFCKEKSRHLRIDTHEDNRIMQHCIEKDGFEKRGMIYADDGTLRIAYEYEYGGTHCIHMRYLQV